MHAHAQEQNLGHGASMQYQRSCVLSKINGHFFFICKACSEAQQVEVTAHEASPLRGQHHSEEWRVLRFDGATRQSVARVRSAAPNVAGPRSSSVGAADLSDVNQRQQSAETVSPLSADPKCLAMEYTKTMAAAGQSYTYNLCTSDLLTPAIQMLG